LVVLVGSNLAWCHPVLFQRIVAAKSARPEMRVVNVDPRKTATSGLADLHLSVAPDGDVALFNGLLCHLAETGAIDHTYVAKRLCCANRLRDSCRESSVVTGVHEQTYITYPQDHELGCL
jgi:assimilatory nitrate reductase catalytic subunit